MSDLYYDTIYVMSIDIPKDQPFGAGTKTVSTSVRDRESYYSIRKHIDAVSKSLGEPKISTGFGNRIYRYAWEKVQNGVRYHDMLLIKAVTS